MSKVIVTGVDGNFGGYVARNITQLKEKEDLIFTSPFEEGLKEFKDTGIDCRVANFNHPDEQLVEAFKGGDTILIISAPFVGAKRQAAHKNAIDAAIKAGVKKVVFLRNSQYAEAMITSYLTSNGNLLSCQGDGKMAYISRLDCAMAAMYALTKDDMHKQVLNINGPELLTLHEFAAIGNRETGMDVKVVDVSEEEVYAGFDAIGVPRTTDGAFKDGSPAPYSSDGMVTFARAIRIGKMDNFTDDFEKLTGVKPRTVAYMFANNSEYGVGARNSTDD